MNMIFGFLPLNDYVSVACILDPSYCYGGPYILIKLYIQSYQLVLYRTVFINIFNIHSMRMLTMRSHDMWKLPVFARYTASWRP